MTTMQEIFEGRWDAAMMAHAAGMSAARPAEGSLTARVQEVERAARNLEAADPKRGAQALKLLEGIERAIVKAEAFLKENAAPTVRLLYTDGMGNPSTFVITGTKVITYQGAGSSGIPTALENYTIFMRGVQGDREKVLRDALLGAYRSSGGDAEAVRKVAAKVSQARDPSRWQVKGA
jgi:hypothetical protein